MLFEMHRKRLRNSSKTTSGERYPKERKEIEEMLTKSIGSSIVLLVAKSMVQKGPCISISNSSIRAHMKQEKRAVKMKNLSSLSSLRKVECIQSGPILLVKYLSFTL